MYCFTPLKPPLLKGHIDVLEQSLLYDITAETGRTHCRWLWRASWNAPASQWVVGTTSGQCEETQNVHEQMRP